MIKIEHFLCKFLEDEVQFSLIERASLSPFLMAVNSMFKRSLKTVGAILYMGNLEEIEDILGRGPQNYA